MQFNTRMVVYHITTPELWDDALNRGIYTHPSMAAEGFIHCSFREQLEATARKHFPDRDELLILEISTKRLTPHLKVEQLGTASEPFPHIYARIPLTSVITVHLVAVSGTEPRTYEWWWLERPRS